MKHLIRTVRLEFFVDEANGECGLAHANAIDKGFNAFYNGIGIFHDVFEHWFEGEHKYFRGDAAFNIGGELSALAAAWYFYDELGVYNRRLGTHFPFAESLRREMESVITEIISDDYSSDFGDQLLCNVPYQRPIENAELEYQIRKLHETIQAAPVYNDDDARCKAYKDSATFQKIANLYRFGYRMAKRCVEDQHDNHLTLRNFITTWDEFCSRNRAEDMAAVHQGVTFRIYKDKGVLSWTARFERLPGFKTSDTRRLNHIPLLSNKNENMYHYAA